MDKRIKQFFIVMGTLLLLATAPIWLMFVGSKLQEVFTGLPCLNEASCVWAVLPWYLPFSVLLSLILGSIYIIYFIVVNLFLKRDDESVNSNARKETKSDVAHE